MSHGQNESWTWKHWPGLLSHLWKKAMGKSNHSWSWHVRGWLNIINRAQLAIDNCPFWNSDNFEKTICEKCCSLAAVHVIILTSTFVLLWHCKALSVYAWFGMCSFPLWFMLQMKEVQQVYLPYDSPDLSLLRLSLQTLFIVPDLAEQRDVLTHVNSISTFLVWKVCVSMCVLEKEAG